MNQSTSLQRKTRVRNLWKLLSITSATVLFLAGKRLLLRWIVTRSAGPRNRHVNSLTHGWFQLKHFAQFLICCFRISPIHWPCPELFPVLSVKTVVALAKMAQFCCATERSHLLLTSAVVKQLFLASWQRPRHDAVVKTFHLITGPKSFLFWCWIAFLIWRAHLNVNAMLLCSKTTAALFARMSLTPWRRCSVFTWQDRMCQKNESVSCPCSWYPNIQSLWCPWQEIVAAIGGCPFLDSTAHTNQW